MIERIHTIETTQRVDSGRINTLENDRGHMWNSIGKLEDVVGNIRVDVAKILVVSTVAQTVLTGAVVYFFTKGHI
jgi:hypothetical protein